jgi:sensor histidine kinase YesM
MGLVGAGLLPPSELIGQVAVVVAEAADGEDDAAHGLGQEEAFLRKYAEILESRHKGALAFKWELDADVRTAPVPRLLLQPLVENAVKHGALRRRGGGTVTMRASLVPRVSSEGPDVIECTVVDDGPGFAEGPIRQGAIGLSVVRRRLGWRLTASWGK